MTVGRDNLTKAETVAIAAIESGVPTLVESRELVADFHAMIKTRQAELLSPWIDRASSSLIASLANGVRRDEAAVRAAIISAWSNGQTEGQITPAQARQTPDVRLRKDRSPPGAPDRR